MGLITADHAEWAVVDRMRQMMEEPQGDYLATQTYALFTTTLCWVMQHLRIPQGQQETAKDRAAAALLTALGEVPASSDPWLMPVAPVRRQEWVGNDQISVPASTGFQDHSLKRLLINLRDASAHGDARNVEPFNSGLNLVGFTFNCAEKRNPEWRGRITLLRADMRRIGTTLATHYRDAIVKAGKELYGSHFPGEGADMIEEAA